MSISAAGIVPNAEPWLDRWEAQQAVYVRFREERYEVMLDVLGATVGTAPSSSTWRAGRVLSRDAC